MHDKRIVKQDRDKISNVTRSAFTLAKLLLVIQAAREITRRVSYSSQQSMKIVVALLSFLVLVLFWGTNASAQWTQGNSVNGVRVFLDERTGLEWTETIGQVPSSGWGAPAQALVAQYGFRLPSFNELQVMEANGGFRRLKITTAMQQYYETSNPNVLAAAWGNGFRTPQQRQGTGMNWGIGVRSSQGGNQGNTQGGGQVGTGNQNNKIRVLFIFGTKDKKPIYQKSMAMSRQSLNALIEVSQLSKNEVVELEGDNATKNNVLSKFRVPFKTPDF